MEWVSFSTASFVALTPKATRAGLPGTARMSRKMMMEAAHMVPRKRRILIAPLAIQWHR